MSSQQIKNKRLTTEELIIGRKILEKVRQDIKLASKGDKSLEWALRRYAYIRLQHDERGTPMQRRILKLKKMVAQNSKCAICKKKLPEKGAELDRLIAMDGYTEKNTRLVCHPCHRQMQEDRRFS